jgi:hypothetical protein
LIRIGPDLSAERIVLFQLDLSSSGSHLLGTFLRLSLVDGVASGLNEGKRNVSRRSVLAGARYNSSTCIVYLLVPFQETSSVTARENEGNVHKESEEGNKEKKDHSKLVIKIDHSGMKEGIPSKLNDLVRIRRNLKEIVVENRVRDQYNECGPF